MIELEPHSGSWDVGGMAYRIAVARAGLFQDPSFEKTLVVGPTTRHVSGVVSEVLQRTTYT